MWDHFWPGLDLTQHTVLLHHGDVCCYPTFLGIVQPGGLRKKGRSFENVPWRFAWFYGLAVVNLSGFAAFALVPAQLLVEMAPRPGVRVLPGELSKNLCNSPDW